MVGVAFYQEGEYGIVLNADRIKTDNRGIINLSMPQKRETSAQKNKPKFKIQ